MKRPLLIKHIPNTITSLNLLCGCIAIYYSFNGGIETAVYFIFLAAIFDFLDGFTARMLKAYSELGKMLDSLADMVSFGVAPAALLSALMGRALSRIPDFNSLDFVPIVVWMLFPFIITIFSGLRLAKFNIDTRQTDSFVGLPTPANALFIASISVTAIKFPNMQLTHFLINPWTLIGITILFSTLLVSEIRMFSLKFKEFKWKHNVIRYLFLIISFTILIFTGIPGLSVVIIFYIFLSLLIHLARLRKQYEGTMEVF